MADDQDKILALVEAELKKNPEATTGELQDAAKKKFPSVGRLTKRQFNARYPLQIKRRKTSSAGKKKTTRTRTKRAASAVKKAASKTPRRRRSAPVAPAREGADRDAIRQQFLRFASDITAAESRRDLVRVLASVDKYVEAVAKAAG